MHMVHARRPAQCAPERPAREAAVALDEVREGPALRRRVARHLQARGVIEAHFEWLRRGGGGKGPCRRVPRDLH